MIFQFGNFIVDTGRYKLRIKDSELTIQPQVFDLLVYLIRNRDRVVTRSELLASLWGGKVVTDSALGARLKDARKAVDDNGVRQRVIKTFHGRGYQFIAEVIESGFHDFQEQGRSDIPIDSPVERPEIHFAENDGVNIAYQVFGDGPQDLIYIPGWLSNIDIFWEEPRVVQFFLALAQYARVIVIDRRGTGLSDRVAPPTLEEQIDDVTAVMDAANSRRAVFLGNSEGGSMCALFAASHPERTTSLILIGSNAKWIKSDDYPLGADRKETENWFTQVENEWGGPISIDALSPSLAGDENYRDWWAKFLRSSASKADAIAMLRMSMETDLRLVLSTIKVPTLVLQAKDDRSNPLERGRDLALRIADAKFVEMDAGDHVPWGDAADEITRQVKKFMGDVPGPEVNDRILTTVLFIDSVESTRNSRGVGIGGLSCKLLKYFQETVTRELKIYRGHEINAFGGGFYASFDGPGRAVQCAYAIRESTRQFGLKLCFSIHTGECEIHGQTLEGVVLQIAARVPALGSCGDILVSRTVKDLVAGSGIVFQDFGTHSLKGLTDTHQLYKVMAV